MVNFLKRHWLALLVVFNIILIAIAAAIIINHQSKTATIDILVAPTDSTILLNGRPYQNGEYDIRPGEYKIEIKKDGFETKTIDFNLTKDGFKRIYTYLLPENKSFSYYDSSEHSNDFYTLEQIAKFDNDQKLKDYITSREKRLSIISILPLVFSQYTNHYKDYTEYAVDLNASVENCPKILCLKIVDVNGNNEQNALNLIKEKGYNPDDYEIEYIYKPIEPLE